MFSVQSDSSGLLTCLERHYSYECKAAPQERPYVPRPSRTQQLFNPKLLPKLTNETPDALQKKKGVADDVLAEREAERARKRGLEDGEAEDSAPEVSPRRRRSYSSESVSSTSTRSPSPARERPSRRRESRSPERPTPHEPRGILPPAASGRRGSFDSRERYSNPSESPDRGYSSRDSPERRSPSPRPVRRDSYSDRGHNRTTHARREYSRSQSPVRPPRRREPAVSQYRDREDHSRREERGALQRPQQRRPSPPRERSLSPFSKRLALTQAMNSNR
jgi:hypothetical protein